MCINAVLHKQRVCELYSSVTYEEIFLIWVMSPLQISLDYEGISNPEKGREIRTLPLKLKPLLIKVAVIVVSTQF